VGGIIRMLVGHDLNHLRGRITSRDEQTLFVIDGTPLTLEELGKMLEMCQGWDFRIELVDSCEDVVT